MEVFRREESSCNSSTTVNESALIDAYERALSGVQVELRSNEPSTSDDKHASGKQPEPNTNSSKTRVASTQRELISYADLFDDDPQPAIKPQKFSKVAKKRDAKTADVKKKSSQEPNACHGVIDTVGGGDHVTQLASSATWKWSVGDFCVAFFTEDGVEYPARIISIDQDAQTCVVHYLAYENEEVQSLSALRRIYEQSCESQTEDANEEHNAKVASTSQYSHNAVPLALPQLGVMGESPEQHEAFGSMLNAWYTAGYQTGFYLGLKHAAESGRQNPK